MNIRMGGPKYRVGADTLRLDEDALLKPLKWKKPRSVFVCSMTDLFADDMVSCDGAGRLEWIGRIMDVIENCPQHTFQILTKRAENMRDFFQIVAPECGKDGAPDNCWVGVSVENQAAADERIPYLLDTPAAVRWLSCEPLVGHVNLMQSIALSYQYPPLSDHINWVVAGGESGAGARPMHPAWVRSLRDQCVAADVPFLFKQWGQWAPNCLCYTKHAHRTTPRPSPGSPGVMFACGKKQAGRALDGVVWDQYPA
jgi:protein gp37